MSKAKKARLAKEKKATPKAQKSRSSGFPDQNRGRSKSRPTTVASTKPKPKAQGKSAPQQTSQTGFSVPFEPSHRILLVGEGDFSFSSSLLETHYCSNLVATTFETRSKLLEKYSQASKNVSLIESHGARVFYNIDATALFHPTKGGGSNLRKLAPFDRVVFNFPHTGGLTKDVNRQVRANQELCVKFLEAAGKEETLEKGGRIVVTLFEGEPYELWGIRNLARHVGLVVVRSTRFEWERYPGYAHARTLGNLRGTGWKGEERAARMYIFGRPGEEEPATSAPGKKRKHGEVDSDDEMEPELGYGTEDDYSDPDGDEEEEEEEEDSDDAKDHRHNISGDTTRPTKDNQSLDIVIDAGAEERSLRLEDEFEGFDD